MNNIANLDPCREFKGILKDKQGIELGVIVLTYQSLVQVELYYRKGGGSVIVGTIKTDQLCIGDIRMQKNNVGCGSIAMKALLEFAKENSCSKVTGWLSPVDSGHFDRLEHFYKKFGFEVIFNENKTEGQICLNL